MLNILFLQAASVFLVPYSMYGKYAPCHMQITTPLHNLSGRSQEMEDELFREIDEEIKKVVYNFFENASLLSNLGREITFQLPMNTSE